MTEGNTTLMCRTGAEAGGGGVQLEAFENQVSSLGFSLQLGLGNKSIDIFCVRLKNDQNGVTNQNPCHRSEMVLLHQVQI